jgi:hypothetical protein
MIKKLAWYLKIQFQIPKVMALNQNSELRYLFDSLALYRAKYLKLLTEGSNDEELTYCEKAIQFYLSAIVMVKNAHKVSPHFSISSIFKRLTSPIESKPNADGLQTT